jgi:uncharacterized protein (DUF1697 family)
MKDKRYIELLSEIKQKIKEAQLKTVLAANSQMLLLYWQLGNYILTNQYIEGWGAKIITNLSNDLQKEFPQIKGFSVRNLNYMKSFTASYPVSVLRLMNELEAALKNDISKVQQVVALLETAGNQNIEITQQPVAQLLEEVFLNAVTSRVSWSHQSKKLLLQLNHQNYVKTLRFYPNANPNW